MYSEIYRMSSNVERVDGHSYKTSRKGEGKGVGDPHVADASIAKLVELDHVRPARC